MQAPLITADNITCNIGGKVILKDISLRVAAGDFVTIIGPNGAGKSTLMKCLLGVLPIRYGRIDKSPSLKVGYVPQKITNNIALPLSLRRFLSLNNNAGGREVEEVAALAGIGHRLEALLTELSGGEMQRGLLARALIGKPSLLALDEPAQNLDVNGELDFYRLLGAIFKNQNIAVVMISHDLRFVMRESRHVICLNHHVCCRGTPQAVSQDPVFKDVFGREMAERMAVYHHEHNHVHHTFGGGDHLAEQVAAQATHQHRRIGGEGGEHG